MSTFTRLPTAPLAPLPELAEFLAPFHVQFTRREPRQALERYLTGLLTEHPNTNCDTLAQLIPGTTEQRLQGMLTAMSWDQDDLNGQRVGVMTALPTEGDGMLIFDDTGFPKQGNASVGVARQYSGTLGKTGNCQVAVTCHYAERTLAWPVAACLYLPKSWAEDSDRRTKAGVPEEVEFRTKPQIALALLDQAKGWGVRWSCVTADCDTGTTRISWPDWTSGGKSMWSRSASTSPWRPPGGRARCRSGPTPWWGRCRLGRGVRSGGERGARGGCEAGSPQSGAGG